MTEEKEKIWEEATKKSYAENPMGTNWDRISIAMDLYAEREVKKLKQAHVSEQLLSFFLWFRANGELHIDKSIESMIEIYLKESNLR